MIEMIQTYIILLWILFGLMCVISIVVFSLLIRDIIETMKYQR